MVTLVKEEAWVAVVENEFLETVCAKCIKPNYYYEPLSRCPSCRVIRYCSKECQKADWIDHKMECKFLKRTDTISPMSVAPTFIRWISRIAMKIHRGDFGKAFNGRTFKDLIDHSEDIKASERKYKEFLSIRDSLPRYMTEEFLPSEDDLLSIFGKITCNSFEITKVNQKIGCGLYLGLSAHNHGCDAQAFVESDGATRSLVTKIGVKYSKEIVISYAKTYDSKSKRGKKLHDDYFFECSCSWCRDPEHEGWASSVRSKCCPDSACLLLEDANVLACHKCGKIDKMTVDEAKKLNDELSLLVEQLDKDDDAMVIGLPGFDDYLRKKAKVYDRFAKVFSQWNIRLARFSQLLSKMAFHYYHTQKRSDNALEIAKKYGSKCVVAFRKYLGASSHSELGSVLVNSAQVIGLESDEAEELLKEGYDLVLNFYGPHHDITAGAVRCIHNACFRRSMNRR